MQTLVGVGQDFVQLRERNGTERYIPLGRVDVVFGPMTPRESIPAAANPDQPWLRNRITRVDEVFDCPY